MKVIRSKDSLPVIIEQTQTGEELAEKLVKKKLVSPAFDKEIKRLVAKRRKLLERLK